MLDEVTIVIKQLQQRKSSWPRYSTQGCRKYSKKAAEQSQHTYAKGAMLDKGNRSNETRDANLHKNTTSAEAFLS